MSNITKNLTYLLAFLFVFSACAELRPTPKKETAQADVQKKKTKELELENARLNYKIGLLEKKITKNDQDYQEKLDIMDQTIILMEKNLEELRNKNQKNRERIDLSAKKNSQYSPVPVKIAKASTAPTKKSSNYRRKNQVEKTNKDSAYSNIRKQRPKDLNIITPKDSSAIEDIKLLPGGATSSKSSNVPAKAVKTPVRNTVPIIVPTDESKVGNAEEEYTPAFSKLEDEEDQDLKESKAPLKQEVIPGANKFYNRAYKFFARREYSRSVRLFKQFLAKYPNDVYADNSQYWIGQAQYKLGQLDLSEQAFRKVLKNYFHGPTTRGFKTPDSILMLGRIYLKKGMSKKASYYFKKLGELYPNTLSASKARRELQILKRSNRG